MITNVEEINHAAGNGNREHEPLNSQSNPQNAEAITKWLISKISANLGVDPASLRAEEPLAAYALGSVQSVSLVADLEDWVGQKLPPTLLWDYPTLSDVAHFLAQRATGIELS